ncbi:MAG: beta-aspartyl-peptidase [Tissierellia bacterium]|nr:beta-aspartyl-peptidase [Tissierellia bacterium]
MILIKNVQVFAPEYLGLKDILIAGGKIVEISENINIDVEYIIEANKKILVPGFIDNHVHVTGGGGEAGFFSKAPEIKASEILKNGITTVMGLLGTDGYTRNVENLVSKLYGLRESGLSAYGFTGSYSYPSITITGEVEKDILFIDPIIGCKIALCDHRSSFITKQELTRLMSKVRVSSMLSNKAGALVIHMGDEPEGMKLIREITKEIKVSKSIFRPTHMNRNSMLSKESLSYVKEGGYVDYTAKISKEDTPTSLILELLDRNYDTSKVTVSSDANGSYSTYDDNQNLIDIGVSSISSLYDEWIALENQLYDFSKSLIYFTSNVAKAYKLKNKGEIKKGNDADLLILNDNLEKEYVIANGKIFVENKNWVKDSIIEF